MDDTTPTTFVPADDRLFAAARAQRRVARRSGSSRPCSAVVLLVWMLHAVPDAAAKARPAAAHGQGSLPRRDRRPLQRRYAEQLIDERQLHHELSRTVRRFAAEHGAPPARSSMTAADLGAAGHDDVAGVVRRLPATAVHDGPPRTCRSRVDRPCASEAARGGRCDGEPDDDAVARRDVVMLQPWVGLVSAAAAVVVAVAVLWTTGAGAGDAPDSDEAADRQRPSRRGRHRVPPVAAALPPAPRRRGRRAVDRRARRRRADDAAGDRSRARTRRPQPRRHALPRRVGVDEPVRRHRAAAVRGARRRACAASASG